MGKYKQRREFNLSKKNDFSFEPTRKLDLKNQKIYPWKNENVSVDPKTGKIRFPWEDPFECWS